MPYILIWVIATQYIICQISYSCTIKIAYVNRVSIQKCNITSPQTLPHAHFQLPFPPRAAITLTSNAIEERGFLFPGNWLQSLTK